MQTQQSLTRTTGFCADSVTRQLIQVTYRSRCLTGPSGELDILESSRRNNPHRGITGVLVSHGGWFMQVLEGPADAVNDLLASIRNDSRNGEFLLLRVNAIADRDFGEWSMASTAVDAEQFLELLEGLTFGLAPSRKLLQDFIIEGRWRDTPVA